jgi:predicted nucleotidyltransferase
MMFKREKIIEFLKSNRKTLEEQFFVEKIALFGSYARNEQTETSDIDLLVSLNKNTPNIHESKQGLRKYIGQYFNCSVDIASEKYLKPYIRDEILREAVYV